MGAKLIRFMFLLLFTVLAAVRYLVYFHFHINMYACKRKAWHTLFDELYSGGFQVEENHSNALFDMFLFHSLQGWGFD